MAGLFGTSAPVLSDLNLLLQILIFVLLVVGGRFGRKKTKSSLQIHGRIMIVAILLNTLSILLIMGPSFFGGFDFVLEELFVIGFPLTLVHHFFGLVAEILGVILIFRKFGKVRMWMRLTFFSWLLSFVLGVIFYLIYFIIS
jgi:uncharacterized membrane protein YozB (DUF420 family)